MGGWHLKFWMVAQGVTEMVFEPRPERNEEPARGLSGGRVVGQVKRSLGMREGTWGIWILS